MMTLRILFCLLCAGPLAAQTPAFPPAPYRPSAEPVIDHTTTYYRRVHVLLGVSTQWIDPVYNTATVSAEFSINRYNHIGVQYSRYIPGYLQEVYYNFSFGKVRRGVALEAGSYEVAFFTKTFLRGRFTGRKSSIYVGPDLRVGWRHYTDDYLFEDVRLPFTARTTKVMARVGLQRYFGRAVLDLSLPLGVEIHKDGRRGSGSFNEYQDLNGTYTVLLPSLSLGLGL